MMHSIKISQNAELCKPSKGQTISQVSTHQHCLIRLHKVNHRHGQLWVDHGQQLSTHTASQQDRGENRRSKNENTQRLR